MKKYTLAIVFTMVTAAFSFHAYHAHSTRKLTWEEQLNKWGYHTVGDQVAPLDDRVTVHSTGEVTDWQGQLIGYVEIKTAKPNP